MWIVQSEVPRRAALARISAWLSGNDRFLLVTGGMGSGKSVLTRQVLAELRAGNIVHAEHFCQADNTSTIAVSALLGGWSGRLSQALPGFSEDLTADAGVHISGVASGPGSTGVKVGRIIVGDEPPADTFVRTIGRPLEQLADAGRLPAVVLIVDGVEEARDADGRNRILALLSGLTGTALPAGVRVLAMSRPEHNVRVALEGVAQLDLDASGADDVAEYVALRTDRHFATRLSEHVAGNFLLAASILDDLEGMPLSTAAIPALPRSLPGIFRKRLWRMLDEHDQHTLDVLGLLAIARAPLEEPEIATLLGTERHRVRASVNRILPVLAPVGQGCRLVHRGLAEFLLDPDENPLPVRSAALLHADIGTRMYDTWTGRWERCDEPYPLRHLVAHLAMAPSARTTLAALITDPGFLQAKAASTGVDELHADLRYAMPHVPDAEPIDRALLHESHHLRDWDPGAQPGFFLQQLQNAGVLGGYLDRQRLAHLRQRWGTPHDRQRAFVLRGHRGRITALVLTPDKRRVITTAEDGTARVWEADTGQPIRVLAGNTAALTCVATSPDGMLVAAGADDGLVHLWNLDTGERLHCLTGAEDRVSSVTFTPEGTIVVAGSWDRVVHAWSVHSGQRTRALRGHQGRIQGVQLDPDGLVRTWSDDDTTRLWDVRAGRLVETQGATVVWNRMSGPTVTLDGKRQFLADRDVVTVYDGVELVGQTGDITGLALTPGGRQLVAGHGNGAKLLDARLGKLICHLPAENSVTAVTVSAELAAVGEWGGSVGVHALPSGQRRHTLHGHDDHITAIAVTGSLAVTASWDTTARIWDLDFGRERHILRGHDDWVDALAVSPDGMLAVTGSADGTARIWNVHTGQAGPVLAHRSPVTAVAVTPDGTRVVTAARDGNARVWDPHDGTLVRLLAGHEGAIEALAVSDSTAVTGSADTTAVVWDLVRGEPEHTIEAHSGPVSAVGLGACVVTVSGDRVGVWRPELTLHAGVANRITCLAVHPDDPSVLTVGTEEGGLFSYQVVDQGLRTTARPNGRSAGRPDGS